MPKKTRVTCSCHTHPSQKMTRSRFTPSSWAPRPNRQSARKGTHRTWFGVRASGLMEELLGLVLAFGPRRQRRYNLKHTIYHCNPPRFLRVQCREMHPTSTWSSAITLRLMTGQTAAAGAALPRSTLAGAKQQNQVEKVGCQVFVRS